MKNTLAIFSLIIVVTLLTLGQGGCRCILFGPGPENKTPADIYAAEVSDSRSHWYYVGTKGDWHYFEHDSTSFEPDWKIEKKLLPDLQGYRYYFGGSKRRRAPTDIRIHKKFIQVQIKGQPAYRIPFESRGYISPDDRPRWKWLSESDLQTLFQGGGR